MEVLRLTNHVRAYQIVSPPENERSACMYTYPGLWYIPVVESTACGIGSSNLSLSRERQRRLFSSVKLNTLKCR